jgi:hypothetical protein
MNERETYESVKRDVKKAIESIRAQSPEAAEYLDKHLVTMHQLAEAEAELANIDPRKLRNLYHLRRKPKGHILT